MLSTEINDIKHFVIEDDWNSTILIRKIKGLGKTTPNS
jgi:hypothetical protein